MIDSARTMSSKNWPICGDFNDYRERVVVSGDAHAVINSTGRTKRNPGSMSSLIGGFVENVVERRPELDRWTLYHTRGPQERISANSTIFWFRRRWPEGTPASMPEIIRNGQPFRTTFRRARRSSAIRDRLGPAESLRPLPCRCNPRRRLRNARGGFRHTARCDLADRAGRCAACRPGRTRSSLRILMRSMRTGATSRRQIRRYTTARWFCSPAFPTMGLVLRERAKPSASRHSFIGASTGPIRARSMSTRMPRW